MRPQRGKKHGGNRKSQGALARLCEFPGRFRIYRAQRSQQGCSLSLGMLRLAEPPTGRARLRSSLKSPRNPITPFETSRVSTLHPELYKILHAPIQNTAMQPTVANASNRCNSSPHQNPPSFRKSALVLHTLHMLHMSDMLKEKDIRRKSNGFELLPPLRRSPSLEEGGLGGFAGQGLRPCRRLHIGALRSPLSPFARPLERLL